MTGYLLDVNALVALMWPAHEAHALVQAWFQHIQRRNWATCPFTQADFVRVISNPAFSPHCVSPAQALDLLSDNIRHPHHLFWADNLSLPQAIELFHPKLTGHQQITDAYLLGLAVQRNGRLATLDRAVATLAGAGVAANHFEIIARVRKSH